MRHFLRLFVFCTAGLIVSCIGFADGGHLTDPDGVFSGRALGELQMKSETLLVSAIFTTYGLFGMNITEYESSQPEELSVRIATAEDVPIGATYEDEFIISNRLQRLQSLPLTCRVSVVKDNGLTESVVTNATWNIDLLPGCVTNVILTIDPMTYAPYTSDTAIFKVVAQLDDPSWDMPWMSIRKRSFAYPEVAFAVSNPSGSDAGYVGLTTISNRFPCVLSGIVGSISVRNQRGSNGPLFQIPLDSVSIPAMSSVVMTNSFGRMSQGTYRVTMEVKSDKWPSVKKDLALEIE